MTTHRSSGDPISEFIDFLHANGIPPMDSREITANDQVNRYTVADDKPKSKNGVYRLGNVDGCMMGWARSHRQGQTHNFRSGKYKKLSKEERAAIDRQMEQKRIDNKNRIKKQHGATRKQANLIWDKARPADANHPYLLKKQIPPGALRQSGQDLLIPLQDTQDQIWNLQKINHSGFKLFLDGGRVKHCFCQIGEARPFQDDPYIICEGYATGATLHMATKWPVVVAVQANNLLPVGAAFRNKHNFARFIYAADNDAWTKRPDGSYWNPGIEYATKAAGLTGGRVITLPSWTKDHKDSAGNLTKPTDFNDMAACYGLDEVKKMFLECEA